MYIIDYMSVTIKKKLLLCIWVKSGL